MATKDAKSELSNDEKGRPLPYFFTGWSRSQAARHLDDRHGRHEEDLNICIKLVSSLHKQRTFLFSSLIVVVAWSCICVWAALQLEEQGRATDWLAWLEAAGNKFRLIGRLLIFAVVFRFNRCYDRWLQGRTIWSNITSTSLDVTRMACNWIVDEAFADRFCRFVVVFAYATKALLRGNSLADPVEDGQNLIERGYLTQEELDDMDSYFGWQPHYCLDMLSAIWIESHFSEKALMFDTNHKVHSQLFRAIDGDISKLGFTLGDAIRIRASGLPETYDNLHYLIFYFYFILAPVFFAPSVGWVLPILMGLESVIILLIVVMGSDMVEPFGTDRVDLPLELFCQIIEVQTQQIQERSKRQNLKRLARTSNAEPPTTKSTPTPRASVARMIKEDNKKGAMQKFPKQARSPQGHVSPDSLGT